MEQNQKPLILPEADLKKKKRVKGISRHYENVQKPL